MTWWVLLMLFWVILDDSVATDELLAGAGAAALGTLLAHAVGAHTGILFRPRLKWLVAALRLPGQLPGDTVIVFAALARFIVHGEEPRGGFAAEPVQFGGDSAEARTRRALLIGARSFAPNTFALGLDKESGVMVVHRLVHAPGQEAR